MSVCANPKKYLAFTDPLAIIFVTRILPLAPSVPDAYTAEPFAIDAPDWFLTYHTDFSPMSIRSPSIVPIAGTPASGSQNNDPAGSPFGTYDVFNCMVSVDVRPVTSNVDAIVTSPTTPNVPPTDVLPDAANV